MCCCTSCSGNAASKAKQPAWYLSLRWVVISMCSVAPRPHCRTLQAIQGYLRVFLCINDSCCVALQIFCTSEAGLHCLARLSAATTEKEAPAEAAGSCARLLDAQADLGSLETAVPATRKGEEQSLCKSKQALAIKRSLRRNACLGRGQCFFLYMRMHVNAKHVCR